MGPPTHKPSFYRAAIKMVRSIPARYKEPRPKTIMDMDRVYTRALYRLDTAGEFAQQKDQTAYQTGKALAGN